MTRNITQLPVVRLLALAALFACAVQVSNGIADDGEGGGKGPSVGKDYDYDMDNLTKGPMPSNNDQIPPFGTQSFTREDFICSEFQSPCYALSQTCDLTNRLCPTIIVPVTVPFEEECSVARYGYCTFPSVGQNCSYQDYRFCVTTLCHEQRQNGQCINPVCAQWYWKENSCAP